MTILSATSAAGSTAREKLHSRSPRRIQTHWDPIKPARKLVIHLLPVIVLCLVTLSYSPARSLSNRVVHVFVALADNQNQGIVPVPPRLGNGLDADHNLYWGAAAGVKTFFARSPDWVLLACGPGPKGAVLERCLFKYRKSEVYLVADAYRGDRIRQAILDFLDATGGANQEPIRVPASISIVAGGGADLLAYVGHDGLMDFPLPLVPRKQNETRREAIILACASKQFFREPLRTAGAYPLLWTTGLMAPEAYTLKSALDGWIAGEGNEQVRERAAVAYDKYQKCGIRGARRLFASGW